MFVGGFAAPGNEWPLTPIRHKARAQGWRTKYFDERLVFGPIATSAHRLVNLIDQLHQVHDTIVVVGHSMGGLVAEHAAALGAPIDALVTIGTPHRGQSPFPLRSTAGHEGDGKEQRSHEERGSTARPPAAAPGDHHGQRQAGLEELLTTEQASRRVLEVPHVGHLRLIFEQRTADAILEWADQHPGASA